MNMFSVLSNYPLPCWQAACLMGSLFDRLISCIRKKNRSRMILFAVLNYNSVSRFIDVAFSDSPRSESFQNPKEINPKSSGNQSEIVRKSLQHLKEIIAKSEGNRSTILENHSDIPRKSIQNRQGITPQFKGNQSQIQRKSFQNPKEINPTS